MFKNYKLNKISNELEFEISDIDISILNGLRRILISDIPILGFKIDDNLINIEENTTSLNNEIISNRIALIPINISEKYNEEFDPINNSFEIILDVSCENKLDLENITTNNLKIKVDGNIIKNNKDYFNYNSISNEPILIHRIKNNQTLRLNAKATKDIGRNNASFCIVSGIAVYNKINEKSKETDIIKKERDIIENIHIFKFEIINNTISHLYLFKKAIEILIFKLDEIKLELSKNDSTLITINNYFDYINTFDINIKNENDTIGYIIQSKIFDKYIVNKNKFKEYKCEFVGYTKKHPLDNTLILRVTLNKCDDKNIIKAFIIEECIDLIYSLNNIIKEWINFNEINK
jgi:DNA-directed RNA polymerase subunit L